ncbi:uncharacterized protein K452DRAFT_290235 [Aplosporella prunicola CBS 121167]|uniref:Secreted protein n=1 Tax=Aplosporella prunicola CBS 121167 TaxID=1176127 RepID=A0A6A6B5K1_9PEZI|nr:uncharacterized protein K452DRAFT_290235 [Aplosporella prunicola CBS 121167]KAF2139136.1 hypothetical protein K452DRAFT_290235 [Aplosporella prunicola CBS 121167]
MVRLLLHYLLCSGIGVCGSGSGVRGVIEGGTSMWYEADCFLRRNCSRDRRQCTRLSTRTHKRTPLGPPQITNATSQQLPPHF